jgi:hypothetical protein
VRAENKEDEIDDILFLPNSYSFIYIHSFRKERERERERERDDCQVKHESSISPQYYLL